MATAHQHWKSNRRFALTPFGAAVVFGTIATGVLVTLAICKAWGWM